MADPLLIVTSSRTFHLNLSQFLCPKPASSSLSLSHSVNKFLSISRFKRKNSIATAVEDEKSSQIGNANDVELEERDREIYGPRVGKKLSRKRSERFIYLVAAVMSSIGITSMALMSVYCRFSWQMESFNYIVHRRATKELFVAQNENLPFEEIFGTFALSIIAAVGMEFWARWAHRALWHASLWHMHKSHHRPREGPFEVNDVFAIINAVPAIALLSYGFFHKGFIPGLCLGAGVGITAYGMAYMFIHDGLVHARFPVGPIANVPYFTRVAAAHKFHHSYKFNGVPYGLFLGHKELEEIGGLEELENEVNRKIKISKN